MSYYWVLVLWVAGLAGLYEVMKRWREPSDHPARRKPAYWPFGEAWWRGYHRALLPVVLALLALAAAGTFQLLALFFGFLAFAIFLPLFFMIFLFNWPKILVPPAARDERGVIRGSAARR